MINFKSILKYTLIVLPLVGLGFGIHTINHLHDDIKQDKLFIYLEDKITNPRREFIKECFKTIPEDNPGKNALVIGADVAGTDMFLPLERGYKEVAFDGKSTYYDVFVPIRYKYRSRNLTITEDWDLAPLPKLDLVMASFVIPFRYRSKEKFNEMFEQLDSKINVDGYFIGNFFGPEHTMFTERPDLSVVIHTEKEIRDLFSDYEILALEEVKKTTTKQPGLDHCYEVFARKVR
jgi:hypothetical protein